MVYLSVLRNKQLKYVMILWNVFNSSDSLCNRRLFLPKLRNLGISVCNFQSMKSPVELNSLFLIFFVISAGLFRRDTGRLANETFTSNPIVSSKQMLSASGLKLQFGSV